MGAGARGGRLCGGAKRNHRQEQISGIGSQRFLCGWNCVPINSIVEHVATCTAKSLSKHLQRVIQVYTRAGFNVRTILMDGEFEKVNDELPLVECNTTAAKEHLSEAERSISTIKERMRGIVGTLPFELSHGD